MTCDTWYEVVSLVLKGWKSCYFWAQKSPNPLISSLDLDFSEPRNNDDFWSHNGWFLFFASESPVKERNYLSKYFP